MKEEQDNELMVYNAMINSYNVIVEDRFDNSLMGTDDGVFVHDVLQPVDKEVLENMLEYFTEVEHYEKCAKITAILDSWTENKYRKI
jgi:hypothetical protein|tara:strand:- start:4476 stop:4736 length:261 start_codon:yes stop_codon:yes gene_type:complete